MILIVSIIAGAWLFMALFTICALAGAAQRPAGRNEEEAIAGLKSK